ncbi:Crp/Fnr family transcriptional regulator [Ilumatobacter nonamiensis]|uniref:Crp/Fnr family transcriptional regulator n=1 Tax=Ilumatobacter nonamiensis TaxID=467093 RepID=UPI00034DBB80|nr:Crp/Fnr family transcriptional regulator [Ilumatobacter nonamiensis]
MTERALLDRVSVETRAAIRAAGRQVIIPDGNFLLRDGESATAAFYVLDGLLKIVKTSPGGRVSVVGLRGTGCLVGELAHLAPAPRSSSLQAVYRTVVLRIDYPALDRLLVNHADFAHVMLEDLAVRLREATYHLHEVMTASAITRMAARLEQLADEVQPEAELSLALPVSQQELGEWAGLSRAGAVKALRILRERGVIETSRLAIVIKDLTALRTIASS